MVATKPEFFEKLRYGKAADQEYIFTQGRNFQDYSEEHGYFEAVVGSRVASEMGIRVGDSIKTTHGDPEGDGHGQPFTVVGILAPTGTPNDRAVFINLEGFYLIDGHARAFEDASHPDSEKVFVEPERPPGQPPRLPLEQRDLTAVLVKAGQPMFAVHMARPINKRLRTQAVSPVKEVTNMLEMFVTPVRNALLAVTIVLQVGGSVLLAIGWRTPWVALALALLVLVISLFMHDFWNVYEGGNQGHEMQNFIKNLGIMAGLLVLAGSAGPAAESTESS